MEQIEINDTIAAVSTAPGTGGIAVIRVSGPRALAIVNSAWKGIDLKGVKTHSVHFGKYFSTDGNLLDEAVATVFLAPASFTGETVVEIGIHGSIWIQRELLNDLVRRGARIANPGEFTQRAFLNGKLDLAQAEGIADLISSSSKAAHDMAMNQTKGKFSKEFDALREKLIEFASLLELELDFSEEDVEFADRSKLVQLCEDILKKVKALAHSYSRGSVLKNGVPVVIAGIPNAGKSSLLNLLLQDEKAIVTDIAGTTRDTIEDTIEIDGILYRFIDTAGLRHTTDVVEGIGVERAYSALGKAFIVIWILDPTSDIDSQFQEIQKFRRKYPDKNFILLRNKCDLGNDCRLNGIKGQDEAIDFSTLTGEGLEELLKRLKEFATAGTDIESSVIVTNARHYEALTRAADSLERALESMQPDPDSRYPMSADFIAQDIREATAHLATITGNITTDNLLHSIFSRFCIGK